MKKYEDVEQKEKDYLINLMEESDKALQEQVVKMRDAIEEINLEVEIVTSWLEELQFAKAHYLKKIAVINTLLNTMAKTTPEILD